MFKYDNQTKQFLCHLDHPLSGRRYSVTSILAADKEKNWSYFGVEVVVDDIVPLLPIPGILIVIVIEYLIEPVLFLIINNRIFGILNWFFESFDLLPELEGGCAKQYEQDNLDHLSDRLMIQQCKSRYRSYADLIINFIRHNRMDNQMIDISSIPRIEFEVNNDELKNCIKELHFQAKTQEKNIQKMKKEIELRPTESIVADAFTLINANIDIDATLLKQIATRSQLKNEENPIKNAGNKLGLKIGQISDVLKILFDKTRQLEKRVDVADAQGKNNLQERFTTLQNQLEELKKNQAKENRTMSQTLQISINKYEEKLRQVESKTLWQINDCKTKLNDRVNEQFVRDVVKQAQAKFATKLKQSLVKNNIDPQRIDRLQSKSLKLEKEIEMKIIEANAKLSELRDSIQHNLATRKEINQDKLDTEKKIGNIQVQLAEQTRKQKNVDTDIKDVKEELVKHASLQQECNKELGKVSKMVANLKISDDFQKLMQNLDPHKICEIDTTLACLAERDLKIQREVEAIKRFTEKLKEKVQICNLLAPGEQNGKLDKEEVNKIFLDLIAVNPTFKKIQTIQGQLYEFRSHGDMINEINKRIGKIQKEFDLQGVIYGLKGLEEYLKKQLLIMNTKIGQFQSLFAEEKRRRPISARKTSDGKLSSSVSYKKLTPVDCISCFQNPMDNRSPQQRKLFTKY